MLRLTMRRPDTRGCEIAFQSHISILFDKVRYFSHYAQEDRAGAGQKALQHAIAEKHLSLAEKKTFTQRTRTTARRADIEKRSCSLKPALRKYSTQSKPCAFGVNSVRFQVSHGKYSPAI